MRIALFGGRFDPVHIAHLAVADYIREELQLDKVVFIPAALPPHKEATIDARLRLDMLRACLRDDPNFEISDIELKRPGPSYSVDTIRQLKEHYGIERPDFFWIMGADNLIEFHKWRAPENIIELCQLVVYPRGHDIDRNTLTLKDEIVFLDHAPHLEISSTLIRERIARQRSVKYLIPPQVLKIINNYGLYSVSD